MYPFIPSVKSMIRDIPTHVVLSSPSCFCSYPGRYNGPFNMLHGGACSAELLGVE